MHLIQASSRFLKFAIQNPPRTRFQILNRLIKNPISGLERVYSTAAARMGTSLTDVESLRKSVIEKQNIVDKQGDEVRALKASKASKEAIENAVNQLKELKLELQSVSKELQARLSEDSGAAMSKEAFRQAVNNTLERRLFYVPSFKIYRGVAGLYDYGPPGCAIKANVIAFWRQHYVLEENMLEVDCPCVTPEVVLKASGHVDKFTDLMVKDEKTGMCYRADHLLKDYCKDKLEKDLLLSPEKANELKQVLAVLDEFSAEDLGAKIKEYGITAPETKNHLSDPYPFNLMFATSIGPSGLSPGYLRPETAQGIFVNFKDLYYYNGNKLPFAAAQIGQAFRNEISPRQGLLRVREFTLAEIEHFVNPDDKSHPKFKIVADLEFYIYSREEQMALKSPLKIRLGEAVTKGTINNETLGYFIGRTYLFLTALGIDKERLRFRQHLQNEMAHYAADCWDAEIECSYGWVECVGLADRSAYDLKAHTEKSAVPLVAHETYPEPREVEKLVITPAKRELGLAFKKNQKMIVEALEAMSEAEAMELKAHLESEEKAPFQVCTLGQTVTLTKDMVSISKEIKKEHQRVFTPSVIEPSFGIGRIIYCLYEHCFYTRPSKAGDEQCNVFRFPPLLAPIKCTVFPLVQNEKYEVTAQFISKSLTGAGISHKIDITGTSIGTDMPRVRSFFACSVSPDGLIYVAGGHDENKNALRAAEAYSVEKDKWEILPPMSQERDECRGVFMDAKFTVISGYATELQGRFERSAEVFDPSTAIWSRVENMWSIEGCPRSCVVTSGNLYFFHNQQVLSYNSKENVWEVVASLPEGMNVATCATVWQGKIFVSGSAFSGGVQLSYMLDNSGKWIAIERPHDFLGFVQSAVTVEM